MKLASGVALIPACPSCPAQGSKIYDVPSLAFAQMLLSGASFRNSSGTEPTLPGRNENVNALSFIGFSFSCMTAQIYRRMIGIVVVLLQREA